MGRQEDPPLPPGLAPPRLSLARSPGGSSPPLSVGIARSFLGASRGACATPPTPTRGLASRLPSGPRPAVPGPRFPCPAGRSSSTMVGTVTSQEGESLGGRGRAVVGGVAFRLRAAGPELGPGSSIHPQFLTPQILGGDTWEQMGCLFCFYLRGKQNKRGELGTRGKSETSGSVSMREARLWEGVNEIQFSSLGRMGRAPGEVGDRELDRESPRSAGQSVWLGLSARRSVNVCRIICAPGRRPYPSSLSCEVFRTARGVAGIPMPVFGNTGNGALLLLCAFPYGDFPTLSPNSFSTPFSSPSWARMWSWNSRMT